MSLQQRLKVRRLGSRYRLQGDLAKVQAQDLDPQCVDLLYTLVTANCPECGITLYLTEESVLEQIRPEVLASISSRRVPEALSFNVFT